MNKTCFLPIIGMFSIILFLPGCQKGDNCLTNAGPIIIESRPIGEFDSVFLYENVSLILTQSTANCCSVQAGSHIISGIKTETRGRQLIIHNNNICNWLRNYSDPINVRLYCDLTNPRFYLYYNSAGDVNTTNVMAKSSVEIHTWGGSGTLNMIINSDSGVFVQHMGTCDINLRGFCGISSIYAGDYGKIDCRVLTTGYTFIRHYGTNNCYVKARHLIDATIGSIGDIYYDREALLSRDSLKVHLYGSGHVIGY